MRARWAVASFLGGLALGASPVPVLLWVERRRKIRTATETVAAAVTTRPAPPAEYGLRLPPDFQPYVGPPVYSPFHDYPYPGLNGGY